MRNIDGQVRRGLLAAGGSLVVLAVTGCAKPDPNLPLLKQGNEALEVDRADAAIAAADGYLQAPGKPRNAAEAQYIRGRAFEIRARQDPTNASANLQSARTAYLAGLELKPKGQLEAYLRCGLANTAFFQDDLATALGQWSAAYPSLTDKELKAWVLYRSGLCEQRMGRFETADKTFDRVIRGFPNTEPARRASEKTGARSFSLLLGSVDSPAAAAAVIDRLQGQGVKVVGSSESPGVYQLRVNGLATYDLALQLKRQLMGDFPSAVVYP